jgi:hypothetical protein
MPNHLSLLEDVDVAVAADDAEVDDFDMAADDAAAADLVAGADDDTAAVEDVEAVGAVATPVLVAPALESLVLETFLHVVARAALARLELVVTASAVLGWHSLRYSLT